MFHGLWLILKQCNPYRSYLVFRFLVTVFLLFKRRQRWLLWTPLSPVQLVDCVRSLGSSFLKLAQVLATRADFFDADYVAQLRQLHDRMPAMTKAQQQRIFKRAFPQAGVFTEFEDEALASASIGQVHRAVLANGDVVAVKLLRANIQLIVRIDIFLLSLFQWLFKPLFSDQTRHSIEAVLRAFSQMIVQEVSMQHELANLEHFSQVYADRGIRFPKPYSDLSSDLALVMSFEEGIRVDNVTASKEMGIEFSLLMEKLVLFYTEQMLVKGYFHADPHPGNLLVNQAGELVLLDFGMVSRIPSNIRQAMIYAVKAAYEHNFEMLISAVRRMGILTEQAPQDQLIDIAESLFTIFDSDHLAASSMQDLAFGVLEVLHDQPFKLPQDVIYVMRVSSLIEGLGTQYIENFNGIKDILPILKDNLTKALGDGESLLPQLRKEAMQLPLTLIKTRKVIELAEQGELTVRMAPSDRDYLLQRLTAYGRRFLWLVFFVALAFYLLLLDQAWSGYGSVVCLLLALFMVVKKG